MLTIIVRALGAIVGVLSALVAVFVAVVYTTEGMVSIGAWVLTRMLA